MVWCYFLRRKSAEEVLGIFKGFKGLVEKHSGKLILRFRCDNGRGEYDNLLFQEYLLSQGITYEPSAPYTQHQNGVSERIIRTIMERARTILLESHLEDRFWAEAVNTSVYLHNRSPTRALKGTTPYEAWHGSKPSLEHLRRFGCDAYVHVPIERRKKLDPKSRLCIHLGYVHNTTKLWRVWDPATERVIHVADVVFDERSFGGRTRTQSLPLLSTLLSDEQSPSDSFVPHGLPPTSVPSDIHRPPDGDTLHTSEVDDTSGGRFTTCVEDRVGDSDEPIPGAQTDDSPMPTGRSTARSITSNGMAPVEGESVTCDSAAPDGHQLPALRKAMRARRPSFWLRDSVTFAAQASEHAEPQTYQEALERPDICKWELAIQEEYKSHVDNGTWELAELLPGKNDITCKWVFRLKTNADGSTRFKARLVIRGFEQVPGIDFHETFAPVAKFVTVRVQLALAAHHDWEVEQMDVKTAFLHPVLEEEVFMAIREGYSEYSGMPCPQGPYPVLRLLKALYGLKQAPHAWYEDVNGFFLNAGMTRSSEDHSLYFSNDIIILLYVDDLLLFAKDMRSIEKMKTQLSTAYHMTDLGPIRKFLGLQVVRDRTLHHIDLHQLPYIQTFLSRFQMGECKGISTPIEPNGYLPPCGNDMDINNRSEYQSKIGSIMYAMLGTRPDLAYTISNLSKHNDRPTRCHHIGLQRVFRYLQETQHTRIRYQRLDDEHTVFPKSFGYTDSDWAGDQHDRKSTSGYVLLLCGGAISWKSRKPDVVATSSTEAEYVALSEAAKESIWLRRLLTELESRVITSTSPDITAQDFDIIYPSSKSSDTNAKTTTSDILEPSTSTTPQVIYADNQGAIKLSENPQFHARTKHIDIRYHYIRTAQERNEVSVVYIPTADMTANLLTKALSREKHQKHMKGMGIVGFVEKGAGIV